jgi:hypothetical protein
MELLQISLSDTGWIVLALLILMLTVRFLRRRR